MVAFDVSYVSSCLVWIIAFLFISYSMIFMFSIFHSLSNQYKFEKQLIDKSQFDKYNKQIITMHINFTALFTLILLSVTVMLLITVCFF